MSDFGFIAITEQQAMEMHSLFGEMLEEEECFFLNGHMARDTGEAYMMGCRHCAITKAMNYLEDGGLLL